MGPHNDILPSGVAPRQIQGVKIFISGWPWHHETIVKVAEIICYRDIWPFWYSDAKMVDFGGFRQPWGTEGNTADGLAREGNLDIWPSWHQLTCLAAFLVFLGAKISIFWWLWHHANIAFV